MNERHLAILAWLADGPQAETDGPRAGYPIKNGYVTTRALCDRGLVEWSRDRSGDRPGPLTWSITDQGRVALAAGH